MEEKNKGIIRRYYHELWNKWNLPLANELIAIDFSFRGSLAVEVQGLEGFKGYVNMVRAAFPDFHNTIEDLIAEDDKVVARLMYSATHRGEIFGVAPTGRKVEYSGMAIFRIVGNKIVNGWVLGDTPTLMRQLGKSIE
jgi:predicted ester cyclase